MMSGPVPDAGPANLTEAGELQLATTSVAGAQLQVRGSAGS
jgi:hypothetical protein